jgi:putative membrane protein
MTRQDGGKPMPKALIEMVAAAGSALALLHSAAWAQTPSDADRYAYGPHMMWWGGGWYGMILGPLFMILVLAVLITAVVLLVRWVGGSGTIVPSHRTPLDILKERFARGEIDKNEFEERRRVLGE